MEAGLGRIAEQVRARAPQARLMFVQYMPMVPLVGCELVPLTAPELSAARKVAERLKAITAKVASKWQVDVIDPADDGVAHDPCALDAWASGFPLPGGSTFVPFHPNLSGMTALSNKIDMVLGK